MKIEEVIKLVKQLDAMTDEDFRVLENIVFVRGLAREIKLKHRAGPRGAQENEAYYKLKKGLYPDS